MKPFKWKITRKKMQDALEEDTDMKEELLTFEQVIRLGVRYASASLSASDAREQVDSEHNS